MSFNGKNMVTTYIELVPDLGCKETVRVI